VGNEVVKELLGHMCSFSECCCTVQSVYTAVFMALVVNMEDRILAVTAENAPEFPLVRKVVILLVKLPPLAYMV
jgi:DICT domain-containing protein